MPVLLRIVLVVLALTSSFLSFRTARADSVDDALTKVTTNRFADTRAAVSAVAASGLPDASAILDALSAGRLRYDDATKTVYFLDASGQLHNAKTGAPTTGVAADSLKRVRVDNGVRSAVDVAQSLLRIASVDPAQRLAAARDIFATRPPGSRALVDQALQKESDPNVKAALLQAQAALTASDSDASISDRLDAIAVIGRRGDQQAMSLLDAIGAGAPPALSAAIVSAKASIETHLRLVEAAQNVWYGLSLGSVLLLAAIGLAITFGVMGVINMAHGEMAMLGAYCTYGAQQFLRAYAPSWLGFSMLLAIPLAFCVTGALGAAIETTMIRRLRGRPLETLLATFGLSLILQQAVRSLFGAQNQNVVTPPFMAGSFHVAGLEINAGRLWIIVFALGVFAALQLVLRATPFGLRLRAATQNRRMAASMGISAGRIDALAFALGSGIAGMAGVALSQIDNVSPNLGQNYIIDSFLVVVFGGVGNLWGTLFAAFALGVANKLIEPAAGAVLAKIAVLVFVILFIQKRPRGLFPVKGRAVEA